MHAARNLTTIVIAVVLAVLPEVALHRPRPRPDRDPSRRGGRAIYAPGDHEDHRLRRWPDAHVVELRSACRDGTVGPDDAVALRGVAGGSPGIVETGTDVAADRPHPGPRRTAVPRGPSISCRRRWAGRRHRRARRQVRDDGARAVELDRRRDLDAGRQRTACHPMGDARGGAAGVRRLRAEWQQQDHDGLALVERDVLGRRAHPARRLRVLPIDIAATSSRIIAIGTTGQLRRILGSSSRVRAGPGPRDMFLQDSGQPGRMSSAGDVHQLRFRPVPADRLELGPVRDLGVVDARRPHVAPREHHGGFEGVRPDSIVRIVAWRRAGWPSDTAVCAAPWMTLRWSSGGRRTWCIGPGCRRRPRAATRPFTWSRRPR